MQLDRIVIQVEVAARRWLPAGLVFLANAWVHRWKGEAELGELPRLVTPGTVAIDVGAHFGTYSQALSRLVGKTGKVISVEPISEDAAFLRAAARQLRLPIEVCACALSDTAGEATLRIPARFGQQKTALATLEGHQGEGEARTVPVLRLDDLLAGERRPVSFIKVDVEGHEAAVLEGARLTIATHKPNLLIEIEGRFLDCSVQDVIDQVLAFGYRGEFLDAAGQRRPVSRFDEAVHQDRAIDPLDPRYVCNFLFTPS
jgi:FkbM family methyltransferase